ncbi:glycosyltransferase family 2 protein [Candidatus Falkowbacteria bacterium]|nr:glycosyltransferase family 2 protein [Candidatus Falkowbacteria bacterium]MBT4432935.1 glycosyltransferase family 2 protein [Candidatus Falkowbacteria bacterium]
MNNNNTIYLSVVIPCFNEEDSVKLLHSKILSVCENLNNSFEIIFINDGSTDNTLQKLKQLKPIRIINFRKNFGQTAALDAGFKKAQGKIIIAMDGDLQNDPDDIPKLLKELSEKNYDVVSGWRKNRKDSLSKKIISRGANKLRKFFINEGIHDSGCTLKAYRKECLKNLNLYGEMHRFIPAILKWKGFKIGEIEVKHHSRIHGKTKYSWKRTVKGLLDMINLWFWKKYSSRPLHFFGGLGILFMLISFSSGAYAFYLKIFQKIDLSDTALTLFSVFLFLSGIQLLIFGILSDILIKSYYQKSKEEPYLIKEIIDL